MKLFKFAFTFPLILCIIVIPVYVLGRSIGSRILFENTVVDCILKPITRKIYYAEIFFLEDGSIICKSLETT